MSLSWYPTWHDLFRNDWCLPRSCMPTPACVNIIGKSWLSSINAIQLNIVVLLMNKWVLLLMQTADFHTHLLPRVRNLNAAGCNFQEACPDRNECFLIGQFAAHPEMSSWRFPVLTSPINIILGWLISAFHYSHFWHELQTALNGGKNYS